MALIDVVHDQTQLLELLIAHARWMDKIFDVHHISFEQLMDAMLGCTVKFQRGDRPAFDVRKAVGHKTQIS